jgi:hypothetical protein
MVRRYIALCLAPLMVLACRHEDVATRPNDSDASRAAPPESDLPHVRVLDDIAKHQGKRVVLEGTYEVQPIRVGKGGKLVWLVLLDGTHVSRAYAPIVAELPYASRRVFATGTVTSGPPDPNMQALLAPHLAVEKLELAANEPPLDPEIRDVPAPPVVSTTRDLAAHVDRWVQVVGTLATLKGDRATLELSDGAVVHVEHVDARLYGAHLGKIVTVTGRLQMDGGRAAHAVDLVIRGATALCAGTVARCGM